MTAMTAAAVKDELSLLPAGRMCCRRAELSVVLHFTGAVDLSAGRVEVEAELDSLLLARRLRRDIGGLYGYPTSAAVLASSAAAGGRRYVVRVQRNGELLARATGLIDRAGRPVRGLAPMIVTGNGCDAAAAWRGAFLASGVLTETRGSSVLAVVCPGPEAALGLVGAARRLGVPAKTGQARGADRVVVRDAEAIARLLTELGAHGCARGWRERQLRRQAPVAVSQVASFDDANGRRIARAAAAAVARVQAAMVLLAGEAPEHLLAAGRLRLAHPHVSLEQLGALADPPMTKDAVAGMLRRLLAVADLRATSLNLPSTQAAVTPELLDAADQDYGTRLRAR